MGEAAHATGAGYPVKHDGKTYIVSPVTIPMLGLFEVWLENAAFEKVERQRGRLDPVTYQERLDAVTRQVCSGQFAYGGTAFRDAAKSAEGEKYLFYLCLKRGHPEMTEELSASIWESDREAARARMQAANADPNLDTPPPTP